MTEQEQNKIEETIVQAIQRLIGSESEDFVEDTILGSDINQIRHIFYLLKAEQKPIIVTYNSENYRGLIRTVEDMRIGIEIPDIRESLARRCRLKFEASSVLYEFEVLITEFHQGLIQIRIPYLIQSAKRRKYKRIFADDIYIRFVTRYQPFFDSRSDIQIADLKFPQVIHELKQDLPDLNLINRILTDEIQKISKNYEIRFFTPEEKLSVRSKLMKEENKTLFVSNVARIESYFVRIVSHNLINFRKIYLDLLRKVSEEKANEYFKELQKEDTRKFLHHFVCSPITIFDDVVGEVFVYTTLLENKIITDEQAHTLDLLIRLFSYALSRTVIARSYLSHPVTRVSNLSLSGLLFELKDRQLFNYLVFHDQIRVSLQVKDNILQFTGAISRYFPTDRGYNVGINFIDADPESFKLLERFIYEKRKSEILVAGKK